MGEEEFIEEIIDVIKKLELKEDDYRNTPHQKVVEHLRDYWQKTRGLFLERPGEMGLDFTGSQKEHGKFKLAIEVDGGHKAFRSWRKLANIRAENKIWIYIPNILRIRAEEGVERRFKEAKKLIQDLLNFRGENVKDFGKFAILLKTPSTLKVEWVFK